MRSDRASSAMGGNKKKSKSKKGSKKHVHEMHIRHAANGGYIVRHHFKPQPNSQGQTDVPEPEEHAIPDMGGLAQHVQDNMMPQPQAQPQPQTAAV